MKNRDVIYPIGTVVLLDDYEPPVIIVGSR